ncbi:MAG: hypothetical protein JOY62_01825 [Acidobacteriaceae bacterium]|nr:hypothetical protein [Acidobacteriaceae bacterium]MBV9778686.1 hypothetical protein [Acidobacteriaceae bacterium]
MKSKLTAFFSCVTLILCSAAIAVGQDQAETQGRHIPKMKAYSWMKPGPDRSQVEATKNLAATNSGKTLPLWTFSTRSSRDDNDYSGVMVGRDPFNGGGSVSIPTYIVPVIIKTHTIGTGVNSKRIISTKPGVTTFDPTLADKACLGTSNNVPVTLFEESPLLQSALFDFGGSVMGTTQYIDAFQRANFWRVDDHDRYHVLLGPVKTLKPIVINVPANDGTTLPASLTGLCATEGIVDINWFDAYLDSTVIPALVSEGVNPSNFPIFLVHDVVWASPVTNLNDCCYIGYHGYTGSNPIQTYSPMDFDNNQGFFFNPEIRDSYVPAHEIGEWMNDPFVTNPTPLWGHVGQQPGCQGNLEVGDPLTGTESLRVVMSNGFTYHLQELTFFSWFFGAPSIGIHGWFSDNATFLTDAGPPCH